MAASGKQNNFIIASERADVTGDGVPDTITLTGYKEKPTDIFIQNITLAIEDGRTKQTTATAFPNNAGYNPRLFLGDFTGDGIADMMISIDSGGSGGFGFYYIYSDKNNMLTKLFDAEMFNSQFKYTVTFRESCRVAVYSYYFKKTYIIDVSSRVNFYAEQGVYNRNCRLLKPTEGFVPGLNNLYPLASATPRKYNLLAVSRVIGLFGADTLGYIETVLEWNGTKFIGVAETVKPV